MFSRRPIDQPKRLVENPKDQPLVESPINPCFFTKIFSLDMDKPYNLMEPVFLHHLLFARTCKLFIFDCRYDYEYKGGHIYSAVPCPSPNELKTMFFLKKVENVIIVFHCEYSQLRGPNQWFLFRQLDREKNEKKYPLIWYPNIFVLNGGYRNFYESFPVCFYLWCERLLIIKDCCGGYTKMSDRPLDSSSETSTPVKISCCRRVSRETVWECSPLFPTKRTHTM